MRDGERGRELFRLAAWVGVLLVAGLLDVVVYRMVFVYPLHDQSWYLYAAGEVLRGTRLYGPRLTETNPPLIVWFSMVPVAVGRVLHVGPLRMLQVVVDALMVVSSIWVVRVLRVAGVVEGGAMRVVAFAATLGLEASAAGVDFGQREMLVVVLVLPYVVAAVCGVRVGAAERMALGVAAGVGVCFKPQQVLVLVGLEVMLAVWRRDVRRMLRLEVLSAEVAIASYLLVIRMAAPLYFRETLPLLRDTYWAYGQMPVGRLVGYQLHFYLLLLGTLLVWVWRRPELRVPVAPVALTVCSLCAAAAYYAQHSWWTYKAFPQHVFLYAAVGWMLLEEMRRPVESLPSRRFVLGSAMCALVLLPFFLWHGLRVEAAEREQRGRDSLRSTLATYPAGTRVYVVSTSLYGFREVVENRLVWSSRYAHLWMLPAIVLNQEAEAGGPAARKTLDPARVQQLAELQRETLAEDLRTRQPVVVVVELCSPTHACQALHHLPLDMLSWFEQSTAFAVEWGHYRRERGDAEWDVYVRVE